MKRKATEEETEKLCDAIMAKNDSFLIKFFQENPNIDINNIENIRRYTLLSYAAAQKEQKDRSKY